MGRETVEIRTVEGTCPAHVFTPELAGPHPGAILYMDGLGMRPTIQAMGQRLAGHGYVVLVPDMFYRAGPYAPLDPKAVFASGNVTKEIGHLFGSTDNHRAAQDSAAFLDYLGSRADVAGDRVGVTGYCMGGGHALTVAGTYPDRVAAAAAFHTSNIATDSPLSPHLLVPRLRARVYIGGADHDQGYPPEMAQRFEAALTDAGVEHRCEIYPDARHGFTMTDFPVYDEAAAERHWRELVALFDATLAPAA
ncbi:MAG TPA: dienelactone hydrolase family protein [Micromonosporaceae bacterium]|jgi:carboxymethylenebutenolidase